MLTIVLPVKDRLDLARRWLSYAKSARFPFDVLVADGSADDSLKSFVKGLEGVKVQYVRYPFDADYGRYYAKLSDALEKVATPYVALADDDDFLFPEALSAAVDFLETHPGHAACGGRCVFFWTEGGRLTKKGHLDCRSISKDSAAGRLESLPIGAIDPLYYDVRRSAQAREIFRAQKEAGLSDLFLAEHLVALLTVIAGKLERLDALQLARQHDPPSSAGREHEAKAGDALERFLAPSWSKDYEAFQRIAAAALAKKDGVGELEAKRLVNEAYRRLVAPELLCSVGRERGVTLSMALAAPVAGKLVNLPRENLLRRAARRVFRSSAWLSIEAVYGTQFLKKPIPREAERMAGVARFLDLSC
jgi:glycosyltransferase domain-containing protein